MIDFIFNRFIMNKKCLGSIKPNKYFGPSKNKESSKRMCGLIKERGVSLVVSGIKEFLSAIITLIMFS